MVKIVKVTEVCIVLAILIMVSCVIYAPYSPKHTVPIENATVISTTEDLELVYYQHIQTGYYTGNMGIFHDNVRNVTCWEIRGGLSCIPDHLLEDEIPERDRFIYT